MSWFFSKPSENELGEYLPDDQAQPYEQVEPIQAISKLEAEKICQDTAAEYGGTNSYVEETGKNQYDCKFKLWG